MKFPTAALFVALSRTYSTAFVPRAFGTTVARVCQSSTNNNNINKYPFARTAKQTTNRICRGGALTMSTTTTTASAEKTVETQPTEVFRKDYQPLPFTVSKMNMEFAIFDGKTTVKSTMIISKHIGSGNDLVLDGEDGALSLQSITVNGQPADYTQSPNKLIVHNLQDQDTIQVVVDIVPETNTQLSGLYKSSSMYCSQCEAMGFRRITYYPDRPDNMAVFESVRIEGDKKTLPLLLSNGNLVESGNVPGDNNNRHYCVWSDPFPKPSYLFALVAGSLEMIQDTFSTRSGKIVTLRLYSEPHNVDKMHYAMDALKRSMQWDEERYGLEYDLDLFNVVAVEDFNMGAMENKSLNVFNTAYVLADSKTATDQDFQNVEAVIGHEYFHNWTGNRVTCRDWFQLTLKEGLTVFRDQEFSADMMGSSRAVKRISDVRGLRGRQFQEDAGPMSHPIRPDSYISMDNFYTSTVYSKGAEIIRMYQTLLGKDGFRKGMDLYFDRHDGQAVTCDDFLAAMADANGVDLSQFARWYSTNGTPTVTYSAEYTDGVFSLTLSQASNSNEGPLHIPVSIGLLDKASGEEVLPTKVLDLKKDTETFTFDGLKGDVVLSILRQFSAPVKLVVEDSGDEEAKLAFLAAKDTDGFNRWESGQKLYTSLIFQNMNGDVSAKTTEYVEEAFLRALTADTDEYALQAFTMTLPSELTLAEEMEVVDPIGIHQARGAVKKSLARKFYSELKAKYDAMTKEMESETEFKVDAVAIGRRSLRNVLLQYLCTVRETDEEQIAAAELAMNHFKKASGMTDKMAAFVELASMDGKGADARDEAVQQFYDDANGDFLVINKWFSVQAMASLPDVLDRVKKLKQHPDFTMKNPNRCRSLIGTFSAGNPAAFHDKDGESYKFLGESLTELDELNPQISSRLAGGLIQWRRFDEDRGNKMKAELEKLASLKLSDDLFEIVNKGLK